MKAFRIAALAAFSLFLALPVRAAGPAEAKGDMAAYRQSIFEAAVKKPGYQRRLMPIDTKARFVTVATLTYKHRAPVDGSTKGRFGRDGDGRLKYATWVSLPSESRAACRRAKDPVRALEQILGMPPAAGDWEIVQFDVAPRHIFRPCASSPDIDTPHCTFDMPAPHGSKAERRAIEEARLFVLGQMWTSFDRGFKSPGYPFTGMGWTYNWDPASKDHFGISEYVVKAGAPVRNVRVFTPAAYCRDG